MKLSPDMWIPSIERKPEGAAKIVALGGDGIGPEVVEATLRCIEPLGLNLEIERPLHGTQALEECGNPLPDETKRAIDASDAVLFGAIDTSVGNAKAALLYLRFDLAMYANLRPVTSVDCIPSVIGGDNTNLVIVRELTEGMYPGREGQLSELTSKWPEYRDRRGQALPKEGAFAVRVITPTAVERIVKFAIRLAKQRKEKGYSRGHISIVHKANVLQTSDGLFAEICRKHIEASGLSYDEIYVDEAARRLVAETEDYDVIVTSNLFGDVLSDVASEAMGGMPMVPSAAIGDTGAYFEACHGSAPDIVGTGKANPAATILSGAMMLSYLQESEAAQRLIDATLDTIRAGIKTADLGGSANTDSFTDAIVERLR
jgi:isocitrate/isopropylmalate dehydrogenase